MGRILTILAAIAAILGVAFFALRTPDTDRDAMIAKYASPVSRFAKGPDGLKVHWRDEGCRACPALVLLHGSNASLHTWEPLVARLSADWRIITYDHPGHGLTGPHPKDDYSARGMFDALETVTQAAGIERFTLAGNSMGGWVAWRYALAHPERVDALLLLDAAGMPLRAGETAPPLNLGFRIMRNPLLRPLAEQITPRSLVKKSVLQTVSRQDIVTETMVDRYWELLRFPGNRRATAIRASADREPSQAENIGAITAPVLVLWGKEDQLIHVSAATTFKERLTQAEVVLLDDVGHIPMEEAPDETAAAIKAFLKPAAAATADAPATLEPVQ